MLYKFKHRFCTVCTMIAIIFFSIIISSTAYAIELEDAAQNNMTIDLSTGNIEIFEDDSIGIDLVSQASEDGASGKWGTCEWNITRDGLLTVYPGVGESQEGKTSSPWADYAKYIVEIRFIYKNGEEEILPNSADYLFYGLSNVKEIDLSGMTMQNVTSMKSMFSKCSSLGRIVSFYCDTNAVEDMSNLFSGCSSLWSIDFSSFRTQSVKNAHAMFSMCNNLAESKLPWFDFSKLEDASSMFEYCLNMKSLDLSSWGMNSLNNMEYMFNGCTAMKSINLKRVNTSKVVSMSGLFKGCSSLEQLDLSTFDTCSVTSIDNMFQGCANITNLDLTKMDVSAVTNSYALCNACTNLITIDVSNWDTSKITNMGGMFSNCYNLKAINVRGWNTSNVTDMRYMFSDCSSLESLDVSGWNTSMLQVYTGMFLRCSSLSEFTTGKSYTIYDYDMFPDATASNGKWWSNSEDTWYTKNAIVSNRKNILDKYTAVSGDAYKISIAAASITLEKQEFAWTGAEIKPTPVVVLNGITLKKDTDYYLEYQNNIKTGKNTATVYVIGKGNYTGTKKASFSISYTAAFKDVSAKTAHVEDVIWLSLNGISTGFPDGTFRPGESVARADMAAFIFRLACKWGVVDEKWNPTELQSAYVDDVNYNTPHSREIRWLVSSGISTGWTFKRSGMEFTRFKPYNKVARQDMAAFLFRLAKLAKRGGAKDTWSASESARKKFRDVDAKSSTNHHNEVWWLAETGVSEGWAVGNGKYEFRGLRYVARQDMAAFLHRMNNLP